MQLEPASAGSGARFWPFGQLGARGGPLVVAALATIVGCKLALVCRYQRAFAVWRPWHRWLQVVLAAFACLPLAGIYAFPVAHRLWERTPAWALAVPSLAAAGAPARRRLKPFASIRLRWSTAQLLGAFALDLLGLQLAAAYLVSPERGNSAARMLLALRLGLRWLAYASSVATLLLLRRAGEISRRRFCLSQLLALSWLGPWPLFVVGFLADVLFSDRRRRPVLAVSSAFASRERVTARMEDLGHGMDFWQASAWETTRALPAASIAGPRGPAASLTSLRRTKTLLLVLDTSALVGLLAAARAAAPCRGPGERLAAGLYGLAERLVWSLSPWHLLLVPAAILLFARGSDVLLAGVPTARLVRWRYLVLSQAAAGAGLWLGALLWGDDAAGLALALSAFGSGGALTVFMLGMPLRLRASRGHDQISVYWLWTFLFLAFSLAGSLILSHDALASWMVAALRRAAVVCPCFALAAGLLHGRSLMRPARPGRPFAAAPRPRDRVLVAAQAAAALLPLGGLLAPLWVDPAWAR